MLRFLLATMMLLVGWLQPAPLPTETISLDNADRVGQLNQIGYGTMLHVDWLSDTQRLAITTTTGILLYDNYGVDAVNPSSTIREMAGEILNVNFYGGQTTLAIQRADNSVFVWHVESNQTIEIDDDYDYGSVWESAFSPDGSRLATFRVRLMAPGYEGDEIHIWNTETGELINSLSGYRFFDAWQMEFLPDGVTLAVINQESIKFWDTDTEEIVREIPIDRSKPFAVSAGGTLFAFYQLTLEQERTLILWNLDTFEELFRVPITGDHNHITTLAFSPDNALLAAADQALVITLYSVETGEVITDFQASSGVLNTISDMKFSPDGSVLASVDDSSVHLWDTSTWEEITTLYGAYPPIHLLAFNPIDGNLAFTVQGTDVVQIWDVVSMLPTQTLQTDGYGIPSMIFSADGSRLFVSATIDSLGYWTLADSTETTIVEDCCPPEEMILSPDGRVLATYRDATVIFYDASTSTEIQRLSLQDNANSRLYPDIWGMDFSPDGAMIATVSNTFTSDHGLPEFPTLTLWDVETGTSIQSVLYNDRPLISVAYSPDGKLIATGDWDGNIALWDVYELTQVATLTGHHERVTQLLFNVDGSLLISGGDDYTIRLWDVAVRTQLQSLAGHTDQITDLALNVDGTLLASASYDGTVRLWGVR